MKNFEHTAFRSKSDHSRPSVKSRLSQFYTDGRGLPPIPHDYHDEPSEDEEEWEEGVFEFDLREKEYGSDIDRSSILAQARHVQLSNICSNSGRVADSGNEADDEQDMDLVEHREEHEVSL
jgi:hypothetical protein